MLIDVNFESLEDKTWRELEMVKQDSLDTRNEKIVSKSTIGPAQKQRSSLLLTCKTVTRQCGLVSATRHSMRACRLITSFAHW
uniref:Uncharacterized protein n=1 Tax=Pararge aegeria TaxID=116150 RepID=S4NXG6_9NEOP